MTDRWDTQDGLIVSGFEIGFCKCKSGVTEGYAVTQHGVSQTTDVLWVDVSDAVGDGVGIALKTGSANEFIPVLFYGVYKMDTTSNVTVGQFVIGASGGATCLYTGAGDLSAKYMVFGGSSYILGYALQTATSGDEILILVGKGI